MKKLIKKYQKLFNRIILILIVAVFIFLGYQMAVLHGRLLERESQSCPTVEELRRSENANEKLLEIYSGWVKDLKSQIETKEEENIELTNTNNWLWRKQQESEEELIN